MALVIVLVIVSAVLFYLRRRRGENGKLVDNAGKYVSFIVQMVDLIQCNDFAYR